MSKINCWEYKKCGRQPGGHKAVEIGICPAAYDIAADGANGGKNGGRICWSIVGNINNDSPHQLLNRRNCNCFDCDFFYKVSNEEGQDFLVCLADREKRLVYTPTGNALNQ